MQQAPSTPRTKSFLTKFYEINNAIGLASKALSQTPTDQAETFTARCNPPPTCVPAVWDPESLAKSADAIRKNPLINTALPFVVRIVYIPFRFASFWS